MDGIQSWSSFEQQQRQRPKSAPRDSTDDDSSKDGIDALFVSPSSSNIAQSAASLLRQAGLSGENDDDFKLKFHWMRPHPSLLFEIEDELMQREKSDGNTEGGDDDDDNDIERMPRKKPESKQSQSYTIDPAIQASRLMKAYRYSQLTNISTDEAEMETSDDTSNSKQTQTQQKVTAANIDLPIEMPKLRINLASLVEPPLMTSWLPIEDLDEQST